MREEQIRDAVRFCNSYTRMPTLLEIYSSNWQDDNFDFAGWLTVAGEEWPSCDNIGHHLEPLSYILGFAKAMELNCHLMTDEENAFLEELPATITIYRGCYDVNRLGLSWTLDKETAQSFPLLNRYKQPSSPVLLKATIDKENVIAYFMDRQENEVLWIPDASGIEEVRT
jgi:hypothetical protein